MKSTKINRYTRWYLEFASQNTTCVGTHLGCTTYALYILSCNRIILKKIRNNVNIAVGCELITRRTCLESASATEYLYFCPNSRSQQPAWSKQYFMLICRTLILYEKSCTHFCRKYAKVIAIKLLTRVCICA